MRISKAVTGLFLCGFVASVAVPVFGQDEGRRQRGGAQGGGPGGGGRGAGMGMMGGQGLAGLLMMEQVQGHLKLDDAQKGELKTLQESAGEDLRKMFTEMREAGGDFSAMQEKMREFTSKLDAKIEEVLDPDQFDRLLGLFAQRGLVQALTHKAIGEKLELSGDTVTSIRKVEEESNAAMRNVFQRPDGGQGGGFGGGGNREEMQKRMEEMREKMQQSRKESEEKILGLLTADQKDKLEKLKGEKFEFPEGRGFGFGGFGGGPGGPGGQGGGRRGGGNQ